MIGTDGTVAAGRHVHLFQNINAITPASGTRHRSTSNLCATATIIISRGKNRIAACWVAPPFLNMTWTATGKITDRSQVQDLQVLEMRGAGTPNNLTREFKQSRGDLITQSRQTIEPATSSTAAHQTAAHQRRPSEENPRGFPRRRPGRRLRVARVCLNRGTKQRRRLGRKTRAPSTPLRSNGDRNLRSRLRSSRVLDRRLRSSQTNRDVMFRPKP